MSAIPKTEGAAKTLQLVADQAPAERGRRVASASAWTLSSMVAMSALRLVSQMVLTHLCLPEHFGVVTLMRTFLTFVEMVSDMGIRNAVISHPRGEDRRFLGTAFSVQLARGSGMWLLSCALAWPAATFYHAPVLMWLLPIAGLESINNGLFSVSAYASERRMRLAWPTLLDVLGLLVSVGTSIVWAFFDPGPWALALGPLVGGAVRALASHLVFRAERVPLAWDRRVSRELFDYSRWIVGATMVSFVAQQFHLLYLGKLLITSVYGVYGVAWNLCAQASKPMTALANRVIIPHLAEAGRSSADELESALQKSLGRFLPACMLLCLGAGLFAPAMFGLFFEASFSGGGPMAQLFAIVVWFMILQHVPRCALLSLGSSRGVASMALWNAVVTVVGIVVGYWLSGGSLAAAILGNAVGNVAGCLVGWLGMRPHGLRAGRTMSLYSVAFLVLLGGGVFLAQALAAHTGIGASMASVCSTAAIGLPVAAWVWLMTIAPLRANRRSG